MSVLTDLVERLREKDAQDELVQEAPKKIKPVLKGKEVDDELEDPASEMGKLSAAIDDLFASMPVMFSNESYGFIFRQLIDLLVDKGKTLGSYVKSINDDFSYFTVPSYFTRMSADSENLRTSDVLGVKSQIERLLEFEKRIIGFDKETHSKLLRGIRSWIIDMKKAIPTLAKKRKKLFAQAEKFAQSKEDPLGRFAFANNRIASAPVPPEANTDLEDELEDSINSHFKGDKYMDDKDAKYMQDFLKKDMYIDVFHEPKTDTVYRGMAVSARWLSEVLGVSVEDLPEKGESDKKFSFVPRHSSSSWSESKKIAAGFSKSNINKVPVGDGGRYTIVLCAKLSDNHDKFMSGPDGLYKIRGPSEYDSENEIVGLTTINVSKIEWEKYKETRNPNLY